MFDHPKATVFSSNQKRSIIILVGVVDVVDKESSFLIGEAMAFISLLLVKRLFRRHNSRLTKT